jgi:tetratricopeptide (TPR) repeat protein
MNHSSQQRHAKAKKTSALLTATLALALAFTLHTLSCEADSDAGSSPSLTPIQLALTLRLEEDALRKIQNLPPPHTPSQAIQRAILKSSALISSHRLHEALITIQQTLDSLPQNTTDAAFLHYQKALILTKRERIPQARSALNDALTLLPGDHPLRTQILITQNLLPPDGENPPPSDFGQQLLRLRDSLPAGRDRDILSLALLSQTLPADTTPEDPPTLAQELTNHPDPAIAATARFLTLPPLKPAKKTEPLAQQLDALINDRATPPFIRSLCAIRRSQIHLHEKEPNSARTLAELAITSAHTPSIRAAALHTWWQTFSPHEQDLPTLAEALVKKTSATAGAEAAAQIATILAEKFSTTHHPETSVGLLLQAVELEPDPNHRQALLVHAVTQAISGASTSQLLSWLENPDHQALLPAHTQFWLAYLALRQNNTSRAQQLFSALLLQQDTQCHTLGRLGHAALTLAEDPDAQIDTTLLQHLPPQQRDPLLHWLLCVRLLSAASTANEKLALRTAQEILAPATETAALNIIAAAHSALQHGHPVLSIKILQTIPQHLRGQHWQIHQLLAQISDGQIPPAEEPRAWNDLLPRLTRPDLITLARERLAAACWNIGNSACAFEQWFALIGDNSLPPQRRAELTYFAALAARRNGDTAKAAQLLTTLTHPAAPQNTQPADPALHCEALLELARIALDHKAPEHKPLELLQKITAIPGCQPDTAAIAAILLAEHLLQESTQQDPLLLPKITTLLTPLAADPQISKDIAFRAKILQGLALLRAGQHEQAEESFLDVVYGRMASGSADASRPAEMYWFARAILEAGHLMEKRQAWAQAAALYRLAETTIPPEAETWRTRRQRIEREHLIFN